MVPLGDAQDGRGPYRSGMATMLAWTLFATINVGIAWCLYILAREAYRHASWHIAARQERRRAVTHDITIELPADFAVVPAPRLPCAPEPFVARLNRVG